MVFLPICLFSGYFCSVYACVVCIVSGYCKQTFSSLPYVVLEFLYRCIDDILNSGESSSSFFNTHSLSTSSLECKVLWMVLSFLLLWSICLISPLVHFKNSPEYVTKMIVQAFISLRFLLYSLVSRNVILLRYSLLIFFFFLLHLFDGICIQYSQVLVIFLFSEQTGFFLV